jgi:hypothetical protein
MPPSDFPYQRLEPVLSWSVANEPRVPDTSLQTSDDSMREYEPRNEPTWNPAVALQATLDQIDAQPSTGLNQHGQPRHRHSYRLVDWLSAIALLVVSVAFAFAFDRSVF